MTIIIDDAGYGDLLFGTVIGAYRKETDHFIYDIIDVKHFQEPNFNGKTYLDKASDIATHLADRLMPKKEEEIHVCRGDILDKAAEALTEKYGEGRVKRIKVEGRAQTLIEQAYKDELRNIGYNVIENRTEKWGKNFWDMYHWVEKDRKRLHWTKSGSPKLKRYKLFRGTVKKIGNKSRKRKRK